MATKRNNDGVKQLDYAIAAVAVLIASVCLFVAVTPYVQLLLGARDTISLPNFPKGWFSMDGVFGFLFFFCIPAYFIWRYMQKKQHTAAVEAAPEQPFKVDVAVVPMKDDALVKLARGRRMTHMLEMNVQIGIKDWQRIKDAGLYDAVLFSYPDTTSTYTGNMMTCHVRELKQKIAVPFYNIGDAEQAKEEFIKNIMNLRSATEAIKEGPQRTSFEL